jgi:cellulose synthase/poly-beta-1,6-N-acetylglucosamine synthase-like glycosyltransferase
MSLAFFLPIIYSILSSLGLGWLNLPLLFILIIIGLIIIVLIRLFLALIPAIIVAAIVYFLSGHDLFWTGIAFVVVALLSITVKI